jgi:hypothetical protein
MITKHGFISNSSTTSFFLGIKKDKLSTIENELKEYEDFRRKFEKYFPEIDCERVELFRKYSTKEAKEKIDELCEYYDYEEEDDDEDSEDDDMTKMRNSIKNKDHVYYGSSVPINVEDCKDMFFDILDKLDKDDYFVIG